MVERAHIARIACGVVRKIHVQPPFPSRAEGGREWPAGAKRSPCGAVCLPIAWWAAPVAACGFEGREGAIPLRTQVLIGVAMNHRPSRPHHDGCRGCPFWVVTDIFAVGGLSVGGWGRWVIPGAYERACGEGTGGGWENAVRHSRCGG